MTRRKTQRLTETSSADLSAEKTKREIYLRSHAREWSRGYYCAVAQILKSEGTQPLPVEMFRSGGDWRAADPEDIEVFKAHGLIP